METTSKTSKLWNLFLTIFGDIKISKWPMWISYSPTDYNMTGNKILEILENIKPGDIILRGYDNYLDSYFIPKASGHGRYSHAGMYVGNNMVTHAVAPHVMQSHLIDFMQCDRIAVLRPNSSVEKALEKAKKYLDSEVGYDFDFQHGDSSLYCFELCGECYDYLEIPRIDVSMFFGLLQRKQCFLAESFFKSSCFKLVFEYDVKQNIDYSVFSSI